MEATPSVVDAVADGCRSKPVSWDLLRDSEARPVWRVSLADGQSVVVKAVVGEGPEADERWATVRGDGVALKAAAASAVSPNLILIDDERRVFIQEDLGRGQSLAEVLLADDRKLAEAAVIAFARSLALLHAATRGLPGKSRRLLFGSPVELMRRLGPVMAELGVEVDAAVWADVSDVEQEMVEPGPWRALVHGDACPDNTLIRGDGSIAFFDFEFGSGGHSLIDTVYLHLPFPSCWCTNRLPAGLVADADHVYRTTAGVTDGGAFASGLAAAGAACVLGTLDWHLAGTLENDGMWGIASIRSRFATRLQALADLAARAERFDGLRTFAVRLERQLASRWPDLEPLPFYPAFR